MVEGQKMAKSLGNYYTLKDLIDKGYSPKAIRFLLLSAHYRQPLNFTFKGLEAAEKTVERLQIFMERLKTANGTGCGEEIERLIQKTEEEFEEAMDDDLDINTALASLFNFVREVNRLIDQNKLSREEARKVRELMLNFDKVLGIIGEEEKEEELPKEIMELIQKREEARKRKDWKTADEIREKLRQMGIILEDTPEGVRWRRIRK
jgi:cysteinyl-tRNA synthetase